MIQFTINLHKLNVVVKMTNLFAFNRRRVEVPSKPGNYPKDRIEGILSSNIGNIKDPQKIRETLKKLNEPQKKHGNVLVADIRNFTHTLEHEDESRVRAFLNDVFDNASTMIQKIDKGGAFVNKLLGDGLFAHIPDVEPRKVVDTARSILLSFNSLKKNFRFKCANLSISITKTNYTITPIGGDHYLDYTLLGAKINSLFRMLSSTEGSLIYIADPIKDELKSTHHLIYVGNKKFKGIVAPVACFSIIRKKDETEKKTGKNNECDSSECTNCYHSCHSAWLAGRRHIGKKDDEYVFDMDCHVCGTHNQCWHWHNCQWRLRQSNDHKPATCCHLCTNFRNCFHSFQLGRRSMNMLTCDKDLYKSLC